MILSVLLHSKAEFELASFVQLNITMEYGIEQ